MKTSEWEKSFDERPARTTTKFLVVALLIITAVSVVGWGISMALFPVQQAGRIVTKTLDADNVINNYEWFKRQHQDVAAMDTKISIATDTLKGFETSVGPRDSWKFDDRTEWNRLNAILLGLRGQRASMVAEYNARSQMVNRSIFKTNELPETLQ